MKTYLKSKKLSWLRWPAALLAAFMIGGIAYGVLASPPATLAGNTIETATANLVLSTDGTSYGTSFPGFDFSNLIPGGGPGPANGYSFYLKNTGGVPLLVKLQMTKQPTNPNSVDLSKVNVLVTTVGVAGPAQSFSLQSLLGSPTAIGSGTLAAGGIQQYKLQVAMTSDSMTGNSASLSGIDLVFSGTSS
jgi:hypothetical protein